MFTILFGLVMNLAQDWNYSIYVNFNPAYIFKAPISQNNAAKGIISDLVITDIIK